MRTAVSVVSLVVGLVGATSTAFAAPAEPSGVTASGRVTGADVAWDPVAGASFYKVALSPRPEDAAAETGASATSLRISRGLAENTDYTVTVTAFDDKNVAGPSSAPVAFRTLAQPSPVGSPAFQPSGNGFLVSWSPSPADGGSPIVSYTASCSAGGTFAVATTDKNATSALVSGIPVADDAACTVQVSTQAGGNTRTKAVRGNVSRTPGAVTGAGSTPTATGVRVFWSAPPAAEAAAAATSYTVALTGCGADKQVSTAMTSATFTVAQARCAGTVTITAANTSGPGPATTTKTTSGDRLLTSPFKLTAVPTAQGGVVSWSPPVDPRDGSSPPSAYDVRVVSRPGKRQTTKTLRVTDPSVPLSLGTGVPYVVLVSAVNGAGVGGISSALYAVGGVRLTAAVTRHSVKLRGADQLTGRIAAPGTSVVVSRVARRRAKPIKTVRLRRSGSARLRRLAGGTYLAAVEGATRPSTVQFVIP